MIIIYDNFLDNPHEVRNLALTKEYDKYDKNGKSAIPGYRCMDIHDNIKLEVLHKIKYLTNNENLLLNDNAISYQYIPEYYKCGSYHTDIGAGKYTCILYLTPDAKDNSGTDVCDYDVHERQISHDVWMRWVAIKKQFLKDQSNPEEYDTMISEQCNQWHYHAMKIRNKFNRMVIFDSYLLHRAQSFFGKDINDSRLTIVSFIGQANVFH
mgnify:CR=1 FL=1|tara:strand:- start:67 stop:696 length:630 start_codon:yes stop_codon:yes gene_type:complete